MNEQPKSPPGLWYLSAARRIKEWAVNAPARFTNMSPDDLAAIIHDEFQKETGTTDLAFICHAYDRAGIGWVLREQDGTQFLFLCGNQEQRRHLESEDVDQLCRTKPFMEFKGGGVVSF